MEFIRRLVGVVKQLNPIYDATDPAEGLLAVLYALTCLGAIGIGVWFITSFTDLLGVWRHIIGSVFILCGIGWLLGCAPTDFA